MNTNFKAPMTGTPLPGVSRKIRKLLRARQAAEKTIERLIAILDAIDGESDLEEGDDDEPNEDPEPSLGWTDKEARTGSYVHQWDLDTEHEHDGREPNVDDEDGGDDEPSLGWETANPGRMMVDGSALWPLQSQVTDPGFDQTGLGGCASDSDLEGEHDGREDGGDLEPSLGSIQNVDQRGWALGERQDREPNGDDQDHSGAGVD